MSAVSLSEESLPFDVQFSELLDKYMDHVVPFSHLTKGAILGGLTPMGFPPMVVAGGLLPLALTL